MIEQDFHPSQAGVALETELPADSNAVAGMAPIELLTQLARRKWLIAKVTGTTTLAGAILCFVLPVKYTAVTKLMPPKQTESTSSMLMSQLAGMGTDSLAGMAGGGLSLKNPNDIYIGLLKSRPIADAIIQKFGLEKTYRAKDMTEARKKLAENTDIVSEKEGFISVSATDRDRKRSAEIANDYTDQLRALTNTLAITEASQRRLFYEEQLKRAKESLLEAELSFEHVQQKKGVVELDAQAAAIIDSLAMARAQVAAKEVEVQALRSYSTEHNPDVQMAEQELSSLQAQVAHLEQHNQSSAAGEVGLEDVPGAGLDYLRAQREVGYQQTLLDLLMKQYEAARLDEAKEAAIIQVVEQAIPPDRKSAPKRLAILLLSGLVGLFCGCLAVRFLNWRERMLSKPESAESLRMLVSALSGPVWRSPEE